MGTDANTTVFLLWFHDDYVEQTGTTYPDSLCGVFSSLKALNEHCEIHWPEFREGLPLSDDGTKAERDGNGSTLTLWVQPTVLDQEVA